MVLSDGGSKLSWKVIKGKGLGYVGLRRIGFIPRGRLGLRG